MASIWVMIFLFLGIAHLMDADALSRIINTGTLSLFCYIKRALEQTRVQNYTQPSNTFSI